MIYFRSGYAPDQYHSEIEWDGRLLMERSLAIKCPSIQYHLAGCKKVQQELARPGVLQKYLSNHEDVEAVKEIFTGLFSLDKVCKSCYALDWTCSSIKLVHCETWLL